MSSSTRATGRPRAARWVCTSSCVETPDIDAVFASNDQMALGVMHAAHRLGLRIPDQLSVVGVDDIAEGSHFWPPLTTVGQPLADAGALAVEVVVQAIRAARPGRQPEDAQVEWVNLLQPRLIVRESSRPARP